MGECGLIVRPHSSRSFPLSSPRRRNVNILSGITQTKHVLPQIDAPSSCASFDVFHVTIRPLSEEWPLFLLRRCCVSVFELPFFQLSPERLDYVLFDCWFARPGVIPVVVLKK